jgi:hypothetical protein
MARIQATRIITDFVNIRDNPRCRFFLLSKYQQRKEGQSTQDEDKTRDLFFQ